MADQVKVTSIDALDVFRARLILFVAKARRSLDDVNDELRRTRGWLEHDRRLHWDGEVARRTKVLNQAQQDLMSARLSKLHDKIQMQQSVVLKAREAVAQAETRRGNVKTWNRNYEGSSAPLAKKLEGLRNVLDHDMPKAIAYLVNARRTLEDYTELPSAPAVADSPPEPDGPQ